MHKLKTWWVAVVMVTLAIAGSASAEYFDMTKLPNNSGAKSVVFETVTASDYLRAEAFGFMRFSFTKGSTFEAVIYGCDTPLYDDVNGTCTSLATLSASNDDIPVTTGKSYIIIDVTTAETAGFTTYVGFRGHVTSAGADGGVNADADSNGLYEVSELIDADRDGSGYVTCTAKNTPDPACKVAGEIIYRDFTDDVNCMIRGCGAIPAVMEHTGVILLRPGVYMDFGCWDQNGTLPNNPEDHTTRDAITDTSYTQDCPDGEHGLKQTTLSLAGWGGTIVGAGRAQGRTDTTNLVNRGYGRTDATYIVNDRGRRNDEWFGSTSFHKSIQFGYPVQGSEVLEVGLAAWGGSPGGWGAIEAQGAATDVLVESLTTATLCVCDAGSCLRSDEAADTGGVLFGIQNITTDTDLLIKHDVNSEVLNTRTGFSIVRARSAPPYTIGSPACTTGYVAVPIGLTASGQTGQGVLPGNIQRIKNGGGELYILRDDYFASAAQITDLTIEPQDWFNEAGGDCDGTGLYSNAAETGNEQCDVNPLASFNGTNRRPGLKDVDVRYWHDFAIDGDGLPSTPTPLMEGVTFAYGTGEAISDPGFGWRMKGIEVIDSEFQSHIIANFGVQRTFEDFLIRSSSFDFVHAFTDSQNDTWDGIRIESSQFRSAFSFECGNSNIRIKDLYATGRYGGPENSAVPGTWLSMLGLVNIECADETNPNGFTFFDDIREDPPGSAVQTGGNYDNGGGQVMFRIRVDDPAEVENIGHVFLSNAAMYNTQVPNGVTPNAGHDEEGCLVGIEDRTAGGSSAANGMTGSDGLGGVGELDILRRVHITNSIVQGHIFCRYASSGMWDDIAQCFDRYDTGGPPQTSCGSGSECPDGLCDTDGAPAVSGTSESPLFDTHLGLLRQLNAEF